MTRRLVIITEIISPYRIPLFNALATRPEIDLHVIFLAETDPVLRQWKVYKEEIRFSFEVLPSWRKRIGGNHVLLNRGVTRALKTASPDLVLCGGYNYGASWQALLWSRRHGVPFVLWSESNVKDMRPGRSFVEFLKRQFLRRCDGFVVPGQSALQYLTTYNIPDGRIFTAVNAVDNDFFASAASLARQHAVRLRRELDLPARYFVFAGRLVGEKGVFELMSAYSKLDETLRREVGLVFVGEGSYREELESGANHVSPGIVRFAGFAQREQLAVYYSLAESLILPTHTDPWGLVVNEAMACGLPIIVTDVAGCSTDLVSENWNGKIVPAKDVAALASAMDNVAGNLEVAASMGRNSEKRIADYSPEQWSAGILRMVRGVVRE
jgi:glycosyltransferase involved in cell wall biosynthesis